MRDYAKLAKTLRPEQADCVAGCEYDIGGNCDAPDGCIYEYKIQGVDHYHDAADAIEELEAQVRDKDYLIQQQTEEIQRLQRDVKKQQEKMIELAGKLPKKGKWSHVNRVDRSWETDEIFGFIVQCSVCGNKTIGASLYCPGCGAKMESQP